MPDRKEVPGGPRPGSATLPARRLLPLLISQAVAASFSAQAATVTVNSASDDGTGCTLREAAVSVNNAATEPGCTNSGSAFGVDDIIGFDPSVEGQTIVLSGGAVFISAPVSINPGGMVETTVDGDMQSQVFIINEAVTVSMNRLAINNGKPGTIAVSGGGISVINGGNLVLESCSFSGNQASTFARGGAVSLYRSGYLVVAGSTFTGNSGFDQGGAIAVNQSGDVTITGSTFEGNLAVTGAALGITGSVNQVEISNSTFNANSAQGGASAIRVEHSSIATLADSTVTGNTGGQGAIYARTSSLEVIDSTISMNQATAMGSRGGGINAFFSPVSISGSTISGNSAALAGAGVLVSATPSPPYTLEIENSTISGNSNFETTGIYEYESALYAGRLESVTLNNVTIAGNNIDGGDPSALWLNRVNTAVITNTIISSVPGGFGCTESSTGTISLGGDSIVGNNDCGGSPLAVDPQLLPLADNGGPTLTHDLDDGSPAIDAGNNAACAAVDQRGQPRPVDGSGNGMADCDIGAVETVREPMAQLALEFVLCTQEAAPDEPYRYSLRIDNDGPDDASGVVVSHGLIAGAGVNMIPGPECVDNGAAVDCDLGTLIAGETVLLGIDIQAPDVGAQTLMMSADVMADTLDPVAGDNDDQRSVEIVPGLVLSEGMESCLP